ncbi:class I adenylate-forming enzyme family protein [Nocardia sp. NPDC058058]|uniref:class I adenylate-forming enzyme family protein n=1 Tax=Nocardia sp. NPDC058058 TaxID=3346317 RepID=UPI0036DED694
MLLYESLIAAMLRYPHTRVIGSRQTRTYTELLDEHIQKRDILRATFPRDGARIMIAAQNYPGYLSTLLAVWAGGAVPILADPALTAHERAALIDGCGIDGVISEPAESDPSDGATVALDARTSLRPSGFRGTVPDIACDTELGRLTSGSTRTPACIEFSAAAVLNAATTWAAAVELTPTDRTLCLAGIYNGLAFNTTVIPSLLTGAAMVLSSAPPTGGTVLRLITATAPSILVAFPAAYERLAAHPAESMPLATREALAGIRLRLSSAARLPESTATRFELLSGPVCDYYGLAETGPVTFDSAPEDGRHGRPLPGTTIRIAPRAHDGVPILHVRTASMGTRYLNYPGEFERNLAEDGSYITSDTGTFVDGRLRLDGRARPTLEVGGRKFSIESVRTAILDYPGVSDCHIAQLTTPTGRDCVGALVAADSGFDVTALTGHLRVHLARFKVPEVILVVPELPRGTTGKVRAVAARSLLTATFDRTGSENS